MKSTYEQILHLLNLDLTPVCKGAFCCPLHSHASVFRFRSKLELLGPSMEMTFSLSRKNLSAPKINIHMHTQEDEKKRRLRQYTQRHDAFRFPVN